MMGKLQCLLIANRGEIGEHVPMSSLYEQAC